MNEIIVLCGIPNSGKSTYAHKSFPNHVVISRDDIRLKLTPSGKYNDWEFTNENEAAVTRIFLDRYKESVWSRKDIVLDNTHVKESYLNDVIFRRPVGYSMRIIFCDCPLWKAYIRNIWRWIKTGKFIPFYVIVQMKKQYNKINKEKYSDIF